MIPFTYSTLAPLGVVEGESEADYFGSGFLGSTALNCYVNDGGEAFMKRHVDRDPRWIKETTDEMRAGKLIHAHVELRGDVASRVIIAPEKFTTKGGALSEGKEAVAWAKDQDPSKILCAAPELTDAAFVYARILANPCAAEIIKDCKSEVTMRVIDPQTGLPVQTRVDVLQPWCRADIKKLGKPMRSFRYAVRDYGMELQAALYDLVDKALTGIDRMHVWIVAQDVYPYEVKVIQATALQLARGAVNVDTALAGIAAGEWGTAQTEPHLMSEGD